MLKEKNNPHKKAKSACDYCRVKKAKCDEKKPCSNCLRKNIDCRYNPEEVNPISKMDKAFMSLESKVDRLDAKLNKLLGQNVVGEDELESFKDLLNSTSGSLKEAHKSEVNVNVEAVQNAHHSISGSNVKKIDYNEIFSDDDLLSTYSDFAQSFSKGSDGGAICKTTIDDGDIVVSPVKSSMMDATNPNKLSELFLDEIFDPDEKDPYMINFFKDYQDLFDLDNNGNTTRNVGQSNHIMDISSLVDESETKTTTLKNMNSPTSNTPQSSVELSVVERSILNEDEFSIRGKMDFSFISRFRDLDLSPTHTNALIESYLEHIYPFYPIVCEATIGIIKTDIKANGLVLGTSACEYFILLALGEVTMTNETHQYWSSESYRNDDRYCSQSKLGIPPGFPYFWSALSMVGKLKMMLPIGFESITIQLLICVYYLKICQLNDFKRELLEGSDMLFHFLELEGHKHTHRDILLRLYWVFLHLERSLYNMKLLDKSSSLLSIQSKVSIPRGCRSNFAKDADTFYSNCYMQNILLANVDDKARMISLGIDKSVGIAECFKIFLKFEYELNTWREMLPFSFQWEDDVAIRSTLIEMDLLKIRYYLNYVTVCQFMIPKYEERRENLDPEVKELYAGQVEKMIERSITFTLKAQYIFKRQSIVDLDPIICSQFMNAMYFIFTNPLIQYKRLLHQQSFQTLEKDFGCSYKKLYCFSLHSFKMNTKLRFLENTIPKSN